MAAGPDRLVEGAVYYNGGTFRRVVRIKTSTTATVEVLATESLTPTERNTPTHTYYRYKLAQPLRGEKHETYQLARWTKKSGWGVSYLRFPRDKKKTRFALGELLPAQDYDKEYEHYSYCD